MLEASNKDNDEEGVALEEEVEGKKGDAAGAGNAKERDRKPDSQGQERFSSLFNGPDTSSSEDDGGPEDAADPEDDEEDVGKVTL
ncbi:hypothetical protein K469DRAFT_718468 [Zopfia rhizophila CBS 207.26]|uniref:Uncharacterized protein n=1 Tax=Zopfia rhizophila CBS 207.26 TaxID=1314779 RepID=A0A6A6DFU8_9PEZI|nr:hypothetical protein K469DRAFT_718468 [Zopfia rhizophila CBS 207.26]